MKKTLLVFLFLVCLISYGQIILMVPWQDDNTLFFKLANIQGAAGYFGLGPIGQGAYKYIATPYILIYKLFGLNPIFYFTFAFLFYFLSVVAVWFVISQILGSKGGKVASFIYAAGYIASDGYIRVFNSVSTSISVIGISFLSLFYWKYYKSKKLKFYFFAIFFYFLVVELARIRSHYLIGTVISFELIFFTFQKFPKNILKSAFRLLPFLYIFYKYFVEGGGDTRSAQVSDYINGILNGNFELTYGLFSGISHLFFPDKILSLLSQNFFPRTQNIIVVISFFVLFYLFSKKRKLLKAILFSFLDICWFYLLKNIFITPTLNLSSTQLLSLFLAGQIFMLLFLVFLNLESKYKKLYLFFLCWIVTNIMSYTVYIPSQTFTSFHRYLAHSFFALTPFLAIIYLNYKKLGTLILVFGFINLLSAASYQNTILNNRSKPVRWFYNQLFSEVPNLSKGDVLYFDVADNSRGFFADAFSVASMPEETAIAWRYGLDRYDIRRSDNYDDLSKILTNGFITDINDQELPLNNIYTFFYQDGKLENTSEKFQKLLKNPQNINNISFTTEIKNNQTIVSFDSPIDSVVPISFNFVASAETLSTSNISFPLTNNSLLKNNPISNSPTLRNLAFDYKNYKNNFRSEVKVSTSSQWRENLSQFITDKDISTVWRTDRVLFGIDKEPAQIYLDLPEPEKISRFVWINSFGNNTPTKYTFEHQDSSGNWQTLKQINSTTRVDTPAPQVLKFPPVLASNFRFTIYSSLDGDSPGISEAWLVPSKYADIKINDAEQFLNNPFGYVPDPKAFNSTLTNMNHTGSATISWFTNKTDKDKETGSLNLDLIFDSKTRDYNLTIPAAGTKLYKLIFKNYQIPGTITPISF